MQTAIQNKFRSIDLPLRMAESPREFSSRIQDRVASTLFMIDVRTRRGRIRPPEYVLLYNDPDLRRTHEEVGELVGRTSGTIAVTLSRVRTLLSEA